MAKGKAPPHAFKKGQSGNPSGRPKLPDDVVEGKKLNQIEVARVFNRFVNYSKAELEAVMKDPNTKALELLIGKIMAEAISKGDHMRMNFILDRMIGKVKDVVEQTIIEKPSNPPIEMTKEERIEVYEKALAIEKSKK